MLRIDADTEILEDMLPFFRRLSALGGAHKHMNKVPHPPNRGGSRQLQIVCNRAVLDMRLPLQDRYYDLPSHVDGHDRRLVLCIQDIISAWEAETAPALTIAQTHAFFGLSSGKFVKGMLGDFS
jgi:hypothetical protein